jgi:hypothetical protein
LRRVLHSSLRYTAIISFEIWSYWLLLCFFVSNLSFTSFSNRGISTFNQRIQTFISLKCYDWKSNDSLLILPSSIIQILDLYTHNIWRRAKEIIISQISKVLAQRRVEHMRKEQLWIIWHILENEHIEREKKKYFAIEICWKRRINKVVIRSHVIRKMFSTVQSSTKNQFYTREDNKLSIMRESNQ